jgi:hypothetical protein
MYIAKGRFILHGWKDKVSPLIVPRFYPGKSMEKQASKEQKFLIVFSLKPDSRDTVPVDGTPIKNLCSWELPDIHPRCN